jgi:nicotinamidase-related amidase
MVEALPYGPLGRTAAHLCVDMQMLFAERTDWHVPWMERTLPLILRIARSHAEHTIFTRFMPPLDPDQATGAWRRYYQRWSHMTLRQLPPGLVELVPPLRALVPPATIIDKAQYSAFANPDTQRLLQARDVDTLVITGAETDVCVLSTVMDAVDLGYRVVLPDDALCSVSDKTHDGLLALYRERYGQQIEVASSETVLLNWSG